MKKQNPCVPIPNHERLGASRAIQGIASALWSFKIPKFIIPVLLGMALSLANPARAAAPLLEHPEAGSTQYHTEPYFEWSDVVADPFPGQYDIQIDSNSNFNSTSGKPLITDRIPAIVSWYAPAVEMTRGTTYYWRVRYINESGTPDSWTASSSFTIGIPKYFDVGPPSATGTDNWNNILAAFKAATAYGKANAQAGCLRLEKKATYLVTEPSGWIGRGLTYLDGTGTKNWILDGNDGKIVVEVAEAVKNNTGYLADLPFLIVDNDVQVTNLTIDYADNSLAQVGGVIKAVDHDAKTFTVAVDTTVYPGKGFIDAQGSFMRPNRVAFNGRCYMTQSWADTTPVRVENLDYYTFTVDHYVVGENVERADPIIIPDPLTHYGIEAGHWFVTERRGGKMFRFASASNTLFNNLTILHCRDIVFTNPRGKYLRVNNVNVLRGDNGRLFSCHSPCNSGWQKEWFQNSHFEHTRDDLMNFGNKDNSDAQQVVRNMHLEGSARNAFLGTQDRCWISDNTIRDVASDFSISNTFAGEGIPGKGLRNVIIEDNVMERITSFRLNGSNDDGTPRLSNIIIRNNVMRDVTNALFVKSVMNSQIYGNRAEYSGVWDSHRNHPSYAYSLDRTSNLGGGNNLVWEENVTTDLQHAKQALVGNVPPVANFVYIAQEATYHMEAPESGLVADDSLIGAGITDLTLHGAPALVDGTLGNALAFDGTDRGYSSFNFENHPYTIAFWISPDQASGIQADGTASDILLLTANNAMNLKQAAGHYRLNGANIGGGLFPDAWEHMAFVWDGNNTLWFYRNGVFSKKFTGNFSANGGSVRLANGFKGQIDEVRFYNFAKVSEEIGKLYQETQSPESP